MLRQAHQLPLKVLEVLVGVLIAELELLAHLVVEILQKLRRAPSWPRRFPSSAHAGAVEGCLNVGRLAALLVDLGNALLKIHAGLDGAQHLVAGAENALEEPKFLRKELIDALIGFVLAIEKIDHDDIVLLAVAVATANALLDALGIPGQIVIDHQGAELEVDALGARLGGDHNFPAVAKVID